MDGKYGFEMASREQRSYRSRETAASDLATLLARLDVGSSHKGAVESDARASTLFIRYCMEVPLNIEWYEVAKSRAQRVQRWALTGVVTFGIVALVVTALSAFVSSKGTGSVAAAQIALFVGLGIGVLQTFAASVDQKSRLAGFAKAAADLKEGLFTFEENWRGKVIDASANPPTVSKDVITALLQELRNARKVVQDERAAYFNSLKSPTELLTTATGALDTLRLRRQELLTAIKAQADVEQAPALAAAKKIADLRQALVEAKATAMAGSEKVKRLQALHASATDAEKPAIVLDIGRAKTEELAAEVARVRAQALLDMAVKGDTLNPG